MKNHLLGKSVFLRLILGEHCRYLDESSIHFADEFLYHISCKFQTKDL